MDIMEVDIRGLIMYRATGGVPLETYIITVLQECLWRNIKTRCSVGRSVSRSVPESLVMSCQKMEFNEKDSW